MSEGLRPTSWSIALNDIRKLCGWVGRPLAHKAQSPEHVRRCSVPPTPYRCAAPRPLGRVSDGSAESAAERPTFRLNPADAPVTHFYHR